MKQTAIRNAEDLEQVLKHNGPKTSKLLGDYLVSEGIITQDQLNKALDEQHKKKNHHLGEVLVNLHLTSQEEVNVALAAKLGIPYVKLNDFEVDPASVSLIPPDIALQFNILPLAELSNSLVIAMENPFDWEALEAVRFNTNKNVEPVLCSAADISTVLDKHYSHFDEKELLKELETTEQIPVSTPEGEDSSHLMVQEANKPPVVRLLDAILSQAILRECSDINIRPGKSRVNVYYRIDGKMQYVRTFHKGLLNPLVSRIKIIGHMDISERRLPQDGHAQAFKRKRPIDLRLSVIPTVVGESVVIRILDKEVGLKDIDALGLPAPELGHLHDMISKSNGLLLVVGPTGSGKSTTLYALLNEIRKKNPHIITIEDPVEYHIENLEQIQTSSARGFTFAEALRHILRHDPDVVMVGEMRDEETARIANKAALTGHLVLSTLHTNDAPSTITRLIDMDVEPYLLGSTLLGVMSQRLLRLNCSHCLEEDPDELNLKQALNIDENIDFFRGKGCPTCNFTGYHGRNAVCELLVITPEIRELINNGAPSQEIRAAATKLGMAPLFKNALDLARQARTSLEEIYAMRVE